MNEDTRNGSPDDPRNRILGVETQHIFVSEIASSNTAADARRLLTSINFNLESRSNKVALLARPNVRNAILNAPDAVQNVFIDAGFGWNTQNSFRNPNAHPEYNAFNIDALNNLSIEADNNDWDTSVRKRAVFDLHRFMASINDSGFPPVQGSTQEAFEQAWAVWRGGRDYAALTAADAQDIDSYRSGYITAAATNTEVRAEAAQALYNAAVDVLTVDELANAHDALTKGQWTRAFTSLVHDLQLRSSTPVIGAPIAAEAWAAKLSETLGVDFDTLIGQFEELFAFLESYADKLADSITDLGEAVTDALGKSLNSILVGVGGGVIGDVVEFLNAVYEPAKTAIRTGDWSDVWETVGTYGAAAVISGVIVAGSVGIAAVVGGPVVAAFVGAGWAAYGLYDAITNGAELIGKISADLAGVVERVEESIINHALSLDEGIAQLARAVAYIFGVDPENPVFNVVGDALVTKYMVDPLAADLPGRVDGTDKREWFFGKNNAVINAGGGDDELYVADASTARGDAGNDLIIGRNSRLIQAGQPIDPSNPASPIADTDLGMKLEGGDGDDWIVLIGGDGGILRGGAGNDVLIGGGAKAHLYGGSGSDLFHIGANTTIHDAETTGDSIWMGLPIVGGTKQWWMEGNTAYWSPFSTIMTAFPVIGSEILATAAIFVDAVTMKFASFQTDEDGGLRINIGYNLGGMAKIEDYQLDFDTGRASGGVVVFEASRAGDASSGFQEPSREKFMQFINLALKAGFGVGFTGWDPVVLDLDGDGYELTTQRNSGVHFEFDSDGFAEKTGWVRPDDGFLVLDANGNGIVDDASEFFGDETQGGFAELATHDLNLDGVIDSLDTVFNNLRVWRDLDSNGATDAGELATLGDLGITSISLAATAPAQQIDIGGNVVAFESTFTLANGTVRKAGDVVLDISHIDTRYLAATLVSAQAAALPQLRGFGNVADLHVAMSEDSALLEQVQAFDALMTSNLSVLKQTAEAVLYAWANVDGMTADPIGANGFDARKLAFLEAFSGQQIAPRDPVTGAVSTAGLDELEASWAGTLESLTLRLIVQSSSVPAFADMTYREDLDLIVMGSADTLKQAYSAILTGLSNDPVTALGEWESWGELLRAVQDGSRRFDNNIVRDDFAAAQLLAAIAESGTSFDLSALAPALGITNLRIGTAGSETLTNVSGGTIFAGLDDGDTARGRGGQDVYLLESGFGDIIIDDEEGAQSGDRIRFVDLNRADVSAARVGDDLVLTVTANGDKVTVLGQFADVVPISSDVFASNNRGIEEIQFADGTVMELPDIAIAVGEGTTGDDVLEGTMHTDVFQGRAGNDLLMGGDDADLYVFDAGDGADIIRDQQTNPLLRAADMLIFGDDIAPEDLVWSRGIDPNDLVITIGNGGDSITIDGQFGYSSLGYNGQFALNSRIELFSFRHYGDVYTHKDIQQQLIAAETTSGDDVTRGFGDDDTFAASAGNDTLVGLDGNDTYFFGRGVGNDAIDEQALYIDVNVGLGGLSLEMGADTVIFAAGIDPEDVIFSRQNEAPDLVVTLDTGETLTVRNQFAGFQTGPLGAQWFDRIEWFEFANGMRISWQDVLLDVTTGSAGDDSLWGDLYQDTLTGGGGNDYLSGGGYADTYIFNPGDGHDIVDDDNQFILGDGFVTIDSTPDILRFGAGITSADISLERIGKSLKLIIGSGAGSVTLQGQNDYYHTGVFGAISNSRIERVEFADGEVWTWQGLNARAINDQTTSGDDIIEGFALEDRFETSAGNDVMRGGDSSDTYVFGIGSGSDRIEETVSNQNFDEDDRVEFTAGTTPDDVIFERDGNDLTIRIAGTSDELTIVDQWYNYVGFTDRDIETFHFTDGTVITKAQIQTQLTTGTAAADEIHGFHTEDTLVGGTGNDSLHGGDGSDRYIFNLGDGQDQIYESVRFANIDDEDRLVFGTGIQPGDVTLSRSGNNLTLSIDGTADSVTIVGQFAFVSWFSFTDVEFFEFANGIVWTKRDVSNLLMGGTTGNDVLVGTFENDELNGLAGNDILRGEDGADIYYFGLGSGHDTIEETVTNANLSDFDQIVLGEDITASDLIFTRNGDALTIAIVGTNDSITVARQFDNYIGYTWYDIERLQFADGSIMAKEQIQALLTIGTPGDDSIIGFHTNDVLDGGPGNDILRGLDGSDTYLFGRGSGNDIIRESVEFANLNDDDRIEFASDLALDDIVWSRSGNDLIIGIVDTSDTITVEGGFGRLGSTGFTWNDIEFFSFADGTTLTKSDAQAILLRSTVGDDVIDGFWTSDVISGGRGNDLLRGAEGNDGYLYDIGDGHDVISDFHYYFGDPGDYIQFGAGITPADVTVRLASNRSDMVLSLNGLGGSVTIVNQISGGNDWEIDFVRFQDGTEWNKAQLGNLLVEGQATNGDDVITGTNANETFNGGSGNDQINAGGGNDIISGGLGNDALRGGPGQDRLIGGTGNDYLEGNEQNDTYVYNLGDGDDVIEEWVTWDGSFDRLEFGVGIAASDLRFAVSGEHYIVTFAGNPGSIRLNRQRTGGRWGGAEGGINEFRFADGTVWSRAQIDAAYLAQQRTDGNDIIQGTNRDDIIDGGPGNDTLRGGAYSDRLIGGTGNDLLEGNENNDTYVYNLGDGDDIIDEWVTWDGSFDRLELGVGIAPSDLRFAVSGEHYILTFDGKPGSITLRNQRTGGRWGGAEGGINEFRFADGTVWSRAQIDAAYLAQQRTDGNDIIQGTNRDDIIDGGPGNDTLRGGAYSDRLIGGTGNDLLEGNENNDTYVYNLGDGDDIIDEWVTWDGSFDRLELGVGIAPSDLRFAVSGEHYILTFDGKPGSITLRNQRTGGRWGGAEGGINEFRFADGTVWSRAQIDAAYLAQQRTDGNDIIQGTNRDDIIDGGPGNDTLRGGTYNDRLIGGTGNDYLEGNENNDTYVYNLGDGNDIVAEWVTWDGSFDKLEFGVGIAPSDVRFAVSGEHYIVTFDGTPGSVTVNWQRTGGRWGGAEGGIDEFHFANGTVWNRGQIDAAYLASQVTDGDDTILGSIRNDVITGGLGNDSLNGSSGTDTATYAGLSTEYTLLTGGGTFRIRDDLTATGINEGTDTLISIETLRFGNGQTVGITSPIILDLDGDGIETLSATESSARFDLDGDGLADDTSWIGATDAFLYLDRDGNGTMSGVEEISFVDDVPNAATDLAGLAAFDTNKDGILDNRDARFADFGVWRDSDGNGAVGAGETATLGTVGIRSINLAGTPVDAETEFGEVAIANTGTFTLTSGATRSFADAALTYFSAASVSFAPALDLLGPDVFVAPRRDNSLRHMAFLPAVEEILEILGAASSQGIADLFDRVAAQSETAPLLLETALTVIADTEREPLLRQRVFDPASIYSMTFQPFEYQPGKELVFELRDADPVISAPVTTEIEQNVDRKPDAPAIRIAEKSSPVEAPGIGIVASSTTPEQAGTELVAQPSVDRPPLNPAQHEMWGGPAWIASLPSAPGDFAEVTMPLSYGLRPKVDLTAFLSQHIADDTALDADIARKLAMIRQDMGSFGAVGTGESDRLRQQEPECSYLYA